MEEDVRAMWWVLLLTVGVLFSLLLIIGEQHSKAMRDGEEIYARRNAVSAALPRQKTLSLRSHQQWRMQICRAWRSQEEGFGEGFYSGTTLNDGSSAASKCGCGIRASKWLFCPVGRFVLGERTPLACPLRRPAQGCVHRSSGRRRPRLSVNALIRRRAADGRKRAACAPRITASAIPN